MTTNYISFDRSTKPLLTQNLMVGQELIDVDWNYTTGMWRERRWTVKKILKTRLVIIRRQNGSELEKRIIVRNDPWQSGVVTRRHEGQSEWARDTTHLFTLDDEFLVKLRNDFAVANAGKIAKRAARNAVDAFIRDASLQTAQEAIEALTTFIANERAAE